MRHNKKFNHLGRKSAHRKAMLSNMACSLIKHKRITTTTAKAKALQVYIEPIITKSKAVNNAEITTITKKVEVKHKDGKVETVERKINVNSATPAHRLVFNSLKDKEAVKVLFAEVAPKVADRPGGYTRILRTGYRLGDNAEMCIIELVDFNENMLKEKAAKKATRTRRAGGKKTTTKKAEATAEKAAPAKETEATEAAE